MHKDLSHLTSSKGVFEAIAEEDDKRDALTKFVRSSRRAGSKDSAHLVKHPVLGGVNALEVLLGSTRLGDETAKDGGGEGTIFPS